MRSELLVSFANPSAIQAVRRCEGNDERLATVSSCSDGHLNGGIVVKVKIIFYLCNVGSDIRVASFVTFFARFDGHIQ